MQPRVRTNLTLKSPKSEIQDPETIPGVTGQALVNSLINITKSSKELRKRIGQFLKAHETHIKTESRLSSKERMTKAQIMSEYFKNPKAHGHGDLATKELSEEGF